jgi:hypothetical protein
VDVTVVVGTFGAQDWAQLATDRAIPSARALNVPVIHEHRDSLHAARNAALAQVDTEFVVHLDADDELDPGYLTAMAAGSADLRAPAVAYVRGRRHPPYVPRVAGHEHDCSGDCLPDGNWIVVGACVRARLVREAGGWEPWQLYEDWALWARVWRAGASIEAIAAAVYIAHVRLDSRNRSPDRGARDTAHWDIHRAVWPELYNDRVLA